MTETELIEKRIASQQDLNLAIGLATSPLIHAISSKNIDLFERLIAAGANASLIYTVGRDTESALLYALASDEPLFLQKLLPLCKNENFYHVYENSMGFNHDMALGNGNLLEVCLVSSNYHMYLRKEMNHMLEKALLIIEHINTWEGFDFELFFQKKDFFRTIFKQERSYQIIIENLKEDYLKPLLNVSYDTSPPHPALYIFDTCYKKIKLLNKVAGLLLPNAMYEAENTLFHYYALKNYPPEFDQYTFIHENVVKVLLKHGFLPNLPNASGEKPEEKLSGSQSYKEFQAKYLQSVLPVKIPAAKKIKL